MLVAFSWEDRNGRRSDWVHMLELRDDLIVDIQDYASPRRAAVALRLRTVFQ